MEWQNLEVDISELPRLEEVRFQNHPLRFRKFRMVVAAIVWAIPILGLSVAIAITPGLWVLWPLVPVILLTLWTFVVIYVGFKKRSYALRERDVTYRKGWIFTSVVTIPFNRIQHTEISQGPLERHYKLSTLKIYTAGGSTSDLSIPGLENEEAAQLKDFVARKAAIYE
jgi:hypothetical protein